MINSDRSNTSTRIPWFQIVESWNRFWFSPADPTPLGFIRLCAGLIIFYVHIAYSWDLQGMMGPNAWADLQVANDFRHYNPIVPRPFDWTDDDRHPTPASSPEEVAYMMKWGVNPRDAIAQGYYSFSIWYHVTDPRWVVPVHVAMLTCIFLFTIGFCTRITSVLAWLSILSYIQRSQVTLFGMDTITNILMMYLVIGPSGAALSVDRLIERYWATRRLLKKQRRAGSPLHLDDEPVLGPPQPRVSANLALRLMNVHLCVIYLASGLSKLLGPAWWNGTAVWGTMANPEFSPVHFPGYMYFLETISEHRWMWEVVVGGGVVFTLAFEIGFAFLVWLPRWRWVMLCSAVLLHTGIALFMGLNTFSLCMVTLASSFIPPEAFHRFLRKLAGPAHFRLYFHLADRTQASLAALVHAADGLGQVELVDAAAHPRQMSTTAIQPAAFVHFPTDSRAMTLVGPHGEVWQGYDLFERLTRSIRLFWPLAIITWIPGVPQLARARFPESLPAAPAKDRAIHEKVST